MAARRVIFQEQRGNSTVFGLVILFECSVFRTPQSALRRVRLPGHILGRRGSDASAVVRRDTFSRCAVTTIIVLAGS